MIARLFVKLPFSFDIPLGSRFDVYQIEYPGYVVNFYPPLPSETEHVASGVSLCINGTKTFKVDTLKIDIIQDDFNRTTNVESDPSFEVLNHLINELLDRLKYVTNSSIIKPVQLPSAAWRIIYLNDDGSELAEEDGVIRVRGALAYSYQVHPLTSEMWTDSFVLSDKDWTMPKWKMLILDARNSLPEVGPSVVLAASALEVFIYEVLNQLASSLDDKELGLWGWLNSRGLGKAPTIEEQFDKLLKYFTDQSLKIDNKLWESLKNIFKCRNSFLHDGEPLIGGVLIDVQTARNLIEQSERIIEFVRLAIPAELQWATFSYEMDISISQEIKRDAS